MCIEQSLLVGTPRMLELIGRVRRLGTEPSNLEYLE